RGYTALEAFLDISIADRLQVCFLTVDSGNDEDSWRQRAKIWRDNRAMIGASDAGAHLDSNDGFAYFTDLIGLSVRERKLLSLEEAVHRLSDQPARFYGMTGRGRIAAGWQADLVVFDPLTVQPDRCALRHDLPGGQARVFAEAIGIHRVMVN